MKSKILFVALIGALVFFSLDRGALVSGYVVNLNSRMVAAYDDAVKFIKDTVNEHFRQREEIKQLRAQNAELEKSAALLSSFAKELNEIFRRYAAKEMKGILLVDDDSRVSSDFCTSEYSSIVASDTTQVIAGDMVKVFAWYDNEWGYSTRLVDLAKIVATK